MQAVCRLQQSAGEVRYYELGTPDLSKDLVVDGM
jgi:hypothetical protein